MRRCPNCNTLLLENTTYCGNCGLKQEVPDEKICIKCNNAIPVDSKFCPHCG
ncbi:MAG: zinc ribbon domain-containing protein, partial [Veillonella sp.]|nr:zinc ribbon domain-containing protein [Veillonella sp.]